MPTHPDLPPVIGAIADDRDGDALGTVTAVFLDDRTGEPTWVGLTDGLHAAADAHDTPLVVPYPAGGFAGGRLRLDVSGAAVRSAPRQAFGDRLSAEEEETLRRHYATGGPAAPLPSGADGADGTDGTDGAMTRSEERLAVSTVVEPWTRAVLRIEEVTEEVMVPVTVTRQRARIEHLPLRHGDQGTDLPAVEAGTGQTSGWVTLYSEQPVVSVERVATERVRLATSWTTEQHTVTDQLRHEELALDTDVPSV